MSLNVCVIQPFTLFWNKAENLKQIQSIIQHSSNNIDLFVLPETFNTGFQPKAHLVAEDHSSSPTLQWMKTIARTRKCAITGSITIKDGERIYNRMYFIYPSEECVWYDKRHLYHMGGEGLEFSNGLKKCIVNYKGWNILLAVCYDLRFPVWLRNTLENHYDILIIVGCWSMLNRAHWKILTKARAIENQCFVLAANNCGSLPNCLPNDEDSHYIGESAIIDPYGKYIIKGKCGVQDSLNATLTKKSQEALTNTFPVLKDGDSFILKN
ncbi:hydrolase, carbon-nitrogen family protein [Entamoeba nuttalli P19]|uniref:Hydrolase, carbon-nitrogen family protein n=1 Tax=Entamoeba nuttalli (strain P19) TaxID=1076696 RepID=K2HTN3_ENTNP|nr:hydrolase, carbon-nitrogen family protein [Entamoeba nuttalli P19]EKE39495.1 hydrolase, carbon-nitrogen family protein [Entamoeba nuttalli P19]|eukprot:XP_008858174.1 hydrolase, carbon-nitrogen family protein [Entamoeba nuttalli P19]